MAFAFEKLLVYQKSVDFADGVCELTEQFPVRYNGRFTKPLADQLNRASLSISSNIAELTQGFISLKQSPQSKFLKLAINSFRPNIQAFVAFVIGGDANAD